MIYPYNRIQYKKEWESSLCTNRVLCQKYILSDQMKSEKPCEKIVIICVKKTEGTLYSFACKFQNTSWRIKKKLIRCP